VSAYARLPPVYFLRHGETEWNRAGRYQGQTDIPLNATGRAQARRNGEALRAILARDGLDPGALAYVTSPLSRAVETMEIAREALGLARAGARLDPRLMEAAYGTWEGRTLAELASIDPAGLERRRVDPFGFVPDGGESYDVVGARAAAALAELDRPSVVVAHGGLSRPVRAAILGLTPAEAMRLGAPQDKVYRIADGRIDYL
jgi:probable phosphoglycerate mutase